MNQRIFLIASFLCIFFLYTSPINTSLPFNKVIIYGHYPLHSHTHSYIHWAFARTFAYLGYQTHWVKNNASLKRIDCSHALFITEGQVDDGIPIRNDCFYIIHNCDQTKYKELLSSGHAIILQVYTHDVLSRPVKKLAACMYEATNEPVIYLPWATDLLPHEIDEVKKGLATPVPKEDVIYFVGTIGGGFFGNQSVIAPFKAACEKSGIAFKHVTGCSMEENIALTKNSFMAPALQGTWQCKQGYIPCRIFKNISYGQMGITNSQAVAELFEGKIVYHADTYKLFEEAKKKIDTLDKNELFGLMDLVKEKHTYINRIQMLLDFLEKNYQEKSNS